MPELRSSLVAQVRLVIVCLVCCRVGLDVMGMLGQEGRGCVGDVLLSHVFVQRAELTSSMCGRELGAPQLSARLETILQPRRCRSPESRSSLVATVRLVIVCLVCCRMGMVVIGGCWRGFGVTVV
jgi:hypothetical protein